MLQAQSGVEEKPEWADYLIDKTNPLIEKAKKNNQQKIKKNKIQILE